MPRERITSARQFSLRRVEHKRSQILAQTQANRDSVQHEFQI